MESFDFWTVIMILITIYAVADILSKRKRDRDDDDDKPPTGGVIA